jgi:hypothetical protein
MQNKGATMKNPIPLTSLFITPDSLEQLQAIAESMSNSSEAWRMMVFTMNYCHQLVEEQQLIVLEHDLAKAVKDVCMELDADEYISAELKALKQNLEAQAKRRRIKVTIKKPKHPVQFDPEAEEDRADYEREQLMRP